MDTKGPIPNFCCDGAPHPEKSIDTGQAGALGVPAGSK